ncbi:MAG: hypothetical protein ACRC8U_06815 [Brooklawnia sp.]
MSRDVTSNGSTVELIPNAESAGATGTVAVVASETDATTPTAITRIELRPVKNEDVRKYAKKGCASCRYSPLGPGLLLVKDEQVSPKVCPCAFERFHKANPDIIYNPETGGWFWPLSES